MAELAITTVTPVQGSPDQLKKVQVGEAVAEGDIGYKSGAKYYLAKNDTEANAAASVLFATAAGIDEYTFIYESGATLDIGVSTASGEIYCVASTAGQAEPHSDVGSSEFVTALFTGTGSSVITFQPRPSGYAKP